MTEPKPLTSEEEAQLRRRHGALAGRPCEAEIARLLATLDAARQSGGAEAGLRKALGDIAQNNHDEGHRGYAGPESFRDCSDTFCQQARAALQAAPVSLDRERLAKAFRAVYDHVDHIEADGLDNGFDVVAAAVITEYGRPSRPDAVSGPSIDTETRHLREQEASR